MNTHMRHTLLMLAVLLGVMNPPGRPPGSESMKAEPRPVNAPVKARCPNTGCQGEGVWQNEFAYSCNECSKVSYYCVKCKSLYMPGEGDKHNHLPAV